MGAHRDKVIRLSPDPGVLYLAGVADDQAAQLARLQAAVDSCCSEVAPPAPVIATDAPKGESTPVPNPPTG